MKRLFLHYKQSIRMFALMLSITCAVNVHAQLNGYPYIDVAFSNVHYNAAGNQLEFEVWMKKGADFENSKYVGNSMRIDIYTKDGVKLLWDWPSGELPCEINLVYPGFTFNPTDILVQSEPDGINPRFMTTQPDGFDTWQGYSLETTITNYNIAIFPEELTKIYEVKIPLAEDSNIPSDNGVFSILLRTPENGVESYISGTTPQVRTQCALWILSDPTSGYDGMRLPLQQVQMPDIPVYTWIGAGGAGTGKQGNFTANDYLWSIDANWKGGIAPTSLENDVEVIYDALAIDLHVDGVYNNIKKISNSTGAGLAILPAASITLAEWDDSDNVITGGGAITIKANDTDQNGTFIVPENTVVDARVEFVSKAKNKAADEAKTSTMKWQYFGPPVLLSQPVGNLFHGSWVRQYAQTVEKEGEADIQYIYWSWLGNQDQLEALQGYEISIGSSASNKTTFFGTLVTGDQTATITYRDKDRYKGQWVISNPFTAGVPLNAIEFTNMEQSVYLYNTGSSKEWVDAGNGSAGTTAGHYEVLPVYTAGANATIPSMQGFVVKMVSTQDGSPGSVKLKYAGVKENSIMKSGKAIQKEQVHTDIRLLSNESVLDKMSIYTIEHSTRGFDNGYDGRKMISSAESAQIYSLENDGEYQVNAVPDMNGTHIAFKANKGIYEYTLQFNQHNTEEKYKSIKLIDLVNGTETDITGDNSEYHFTASNEEQAEVRFIIKSTNDDDKNDDDATGISIFQTNSDIFIISTLDEHEPISFYNSNGQLVYKCQSSSIPGGKISKTLFPSGVYIVKMKEVSRKIIIK